MCWVFDNIYEKLIQKKKEMWNVVFSFFCLDHLNKNLPMHFAREVKVQCRTVLFIALKSHLHVGVVSGCQSCAASRIHGALERYTDICCM